MGEAFKTYNMKEEKVMEKGTRVSYNGQEFIVALIDNGECTLVMEDYLPMYYFSGVDAGNELTSFTAGDGAILIIDGDTQIVGYQEVAEADLKVLGKPVAVFNKSVYDGNYVYG